MNTRQRCLAVVLLAGCLGAVLAPDRARADDDPAVTFYYKAGDGSATAALPDARFFAAAEDEFNVLRIYESHPADPLHAQPVWCGDFSPGLGVKEGDDSDLEAATRIGTRIYWIGSHCFHEDGSERRAHRVLFATDFVPAVDGHPPELRPHGPPYRHLIEDLAGDARLKPFALDDAATRWAKTPRGLNIEALCATPEGNLLIGFRGPVLPGGKSLLVTLPNPDRWVGTEPETHVELGEFFELDLGKDRGFRDMTRWGDGYLILAGHYDKDPDFALYSWTGKAADAPKLLTTDFHGLRPEGLAVYPDEPDRVQVLSDDGRQQPPPSGHGTSKETPEDDRRFQCLWITVPRP